MCMYMYIHVYLYMNVNAIRNTGCTIGSAVKMNERLWHSSETIGPQFEFCVERLQLHTAGCTTHMAPQLSHSHRDRTPCDVAGTCRARTKLYVETLCSSSGTLLHLCDSSANIFFMLSSTCCVVSICSVACSMHIGYYRLSGSGFCQPDEFLPKRYTKRRPNTTSRISDL